MAVQGDRGGTFRMYGQVMEGEEEETELPWPGVGWGRPKGSSESKLKVLLTCRNQGKWPHGPLP